MFPTSNLRMNSIYGPDSMGPPNMNGGLDINGLLQHVSQLVGQEKDKQRLFEQNMFDRQQQGNLHNIAAQVQAPQKPMNTIFREDPDHITPLQQQEMDLKKSALSQKGETDTGKLKQGQEKIDQTGDLGQQKIGISQQRADVYDFKAKNPGAKLEQGKDGILRAINPLTGKVINQLQTGMSQEEFGAMTQGNALERINTQGQIQGENQENLQNQKGNQQTDLQNQRGDQNLAAIATRIKGQQDLQNNKPSFYQGEFFQNPNQPQTYTGSGAGNPNAPASTTSGKDTNLPNQSAKPTETKSNVPKAPTGWKYVLDPTGEKYIAVKDTGGE